MKKLFAFLLAAVTALSLCACAGEDTETTTEPEQVGVATEADIAQLESLYAGRTAYYGDYHDHANTGGTSDGKVSLDLWKISMAAKQIDFAAIVDHKQLLHMNLPEWDNSMFIGGSEAGTKIVDLSVGEASMHYNMIFATPEAFEGFLVEHRVLYSYDGEHFKYPQFTVAEMRTIAQSVLDHGGFFTHVHPKGDSYIQSDDPLDYYYGEGTGLEVLTGVYGNMSDRRNTAIYNTWVALLNMGKRIYATAGSDSHNLSATHSLTTIYSEEKDAQKHVDRFRRGDFNVGPVGIRMCIGDTVQGGECDFTGKRLVVSAGDFHDQEFYPSHTYRIDIYNESGLVFSREFSGKETAYAAIDIEPCMYYRAEVYDVTSHFIAAIGNPIWSK